MINEIYEQISTKLKNVSRMVVGIDGMAAAGKTTLAAELADKFCGEVIHMDDFFLPFELRTAERLKEPGGNVHYERFIDEVVSKLSAGEPFEYGVFDCSVMDVTKKQYIKNSGLVIVEGAYTLRPEFRHLYDLKVFMKVTQRAQEERILNRSNAKKLKDFKERWIPLEEQYFEGLHPEDAADILLQG